MDSTRIWAIVSAVVIVAIVVLGGLLGISPQLDEARAAKSDRVAVEAVNVAHEARIATLIKEMAGIRTLERQRDALREAVPANAEIPDFVEQLDALAAENALAFTSIGVEDALPYVPLADATASELLTEENFVSVPLTLDVEGSYDSVLSFIDDLQQGERFVSVATFTTTASTETPGMVIASIGATVYVLLGDVA